MVLYAPPSHDILAGGKILDKRRFARRAIRVLDLGRQLTSGGPHFQARVSVALIFMVFVYIFGNGNN